MNGMTKPATSFAPPPTSSEALPEIRAYLSGRRGLPAALVDKMIEEGRIGATAAGECVFLGAGTAEIRSCRGPGRRLAQGSSRWSLWSTDAEAGDAVAYAEGAIDALSVKALFPEVTALSSSGTSFAALANGVGDNFGKRQCLAFDSDDQGESCCEAAWAAVLLHEAAAPTLEWMDPQASLGKRLATLAMKLDRDKLDAAGPLAAGRKEVFPRLGAPVDPKGSYAISIDAKLKGEFPMADPDGLVAVSAEQVVAAQAKWRLERWAPPYGKDWSESLRIVAELREIEAAMGPAVKKDRLGTL